MTLFLLEWDGTTLAPMSQERMDEIGYAPDWKEWERDVVLPMGLETEREEFGPDFGPSVTVRCRKGTTARLVSVSLTYDYGGDDIWCENGARFLSLMAWLLPLIRDAVMLTRKRQVEATVFDEYDQEPERLRALSLMRQAGMTRDEIEAAWRKVQLENKRRRIIPPP